MNKIFFLGSCSTCQRIIKSLPENNLDFQDIKKETITSDQLEKMKELAGDYLSLFSKRSMQFRARGLHEQTLTEGQLKTLILEEYTFLKRPVTVITDRIFIGNSKKVIKELIDYLSEK